MHPFFHRPGMLRFRRIFQRCRITLWLILFLVVAAIAYLHLVGLPDFLKQPMLRGLRARGIDAEFATMQLGWSSGPSLAIEHAAFKQANQPLSPRVTASKSELAVDWKAFRHGRLELRSLQVSGGQLHVPVSQTNTDMLLLDDLMLNMRFFSNDVVRVNYCRGLFRGVQTDLIGEITHASALANWKPPASKNTNGTAEFRLREVADTLENIKFDGTPVLRIEAGADGEDMNSFHAELNFAAAAGHTPWGDVTNLVLNAACARLVKSGSRPFLQVQWSASGLATPWVSSQKISFLTTVAHDANTNLEAHLRLDAAPFRAPLDQNRSNWFTADHLTWNGTALLASTNFTLLLLAGSLHATGPKTPWGLAREISLEGHATISSNHPATAAWGWWAKLAPWDLDWQTEAQNVASPKLRLDNVAFASHWRAPALVVENINGQLYGGRVDAGASLDVDSRELRCQGKTDFSPLSVSQLFKPPVSNWLWQLAFTVPPKIDAGVRVVLPPWINRSPHWAVDVDSSLQIGGSFSAGASSFRAMEATAAIGHVTYTNRTWHVSGLRASRPEGDLELDYTSSPRDYRYIIDSRIYPKVTLPLFPPAQQHVLDDVTFTEPPVIHGEIWGQWRKPGSNGFSGRIFATNFVARGESVAAFRAEAGFSNRLLTIQNLSLSNAQSQVLAPWVQADFGTKIVSLTNVAGIVDPELVRRCFRKKPPDFLNRIHFDTPPSVAVSGSFSLTNANNVDLQFQVTGQGLHYNSLLADRIAGEVDYLGRSVFLTNISASLYHKGTALGWLSFVTKPNEGTDFHANFTVNNIDLAPLATGLAGQRSRVEGRLDGDLDLSGPNAAEQQAHWHGVGRAHVHDALLWDIKIFGLLSPVLNLFSPGWGHDRARAASADFVLTNGTVSSDDVMVRFTGFVLKMRGRVDKNKEINARLEAVLSREVPLLGTLISVAFTPLSKLLEYRITGPVSDPVMEPIYVPKFIRIFLHPIKSMKATFESIPSPNAPVPAPSPPKSP